MRADTRVGQAKNAVSGDVLPMPRNDDAAAKNGKQQPIAQALTDRAVAVPMTLWLISVLALAFCLGPPMNLVTGGVQGFFSNGPPRWRAAWALPTQMVLMPVLFVLGHRALGSQGPRAWGLQWARERRGPNAWCFVLLFPTWLLLDFFILGLEDMRPIMLLHHVTCIVAHMIACFPFAAGFGWYFLGVISLEFGSGTCNIFCFGWPWYPLTTYLYFAGMTISNLLACYCAYHWVQTVQSRSGRLIGIVITGVLTVMRQREAHRSFAVST